MGPAHLGDGALLLQEATRRINEQLLVGGQLKFQIDPFLFCSPGASRLG
jgi:hypothetical protein